MTRLTLGYAAPSMIEDPSLGLDMKGVGGFTSILPTCYGISKFASGVLGANTSPTYLLAGEIPPPTRRRTPLCLCTGCQIVRIQHTSSDSSMASVSLSLGWLESLLITTGRTLILYSASQNYSHQICCILGLRPCCPISAMRDPVALGNILSCLGGHVYKISRSEMQNSEIMKFTFRGSKAWEGW